MRSLGARAATGLAALLLAACAHKPPPRETFHYRTAAHPLEPGGAWTAALDADSPDHFAEASRFHLAQPGVLQLKVEPGQSSVSIFVFGSGKKALAHTQARTLSASLPEGDVFVVVRAVKGDGLVRVSSAFTPADPSVAGTRTLGSPVPIRAEPAAAARAPAEARTPPAHEVAASKSAPFPMDDEPDTLGAASKSEPGKADSDDLSLDGL